MRPQSPLIALTAGSVTRPYQPITQTVDGVPVNCYPSKTTIQVDLFTKGEKLTDENSVTAVMENTAVNDLTDFLNFLNSAYVDDWSTLNDVSILANTVQDLSQLINDTVWDYRAMVELEIGFTQAAVGYTGTMYDSGMDYYENGKPKYDKNWNPLDENGNPLPLPPGKRPFKPTPSGGRTPELADESTGWFEQVETEYVKEE